jgi:hypothetical protein
MARLVRLLAVSLAVAAIAGCNQTLAVKDNVVQAVAAAVAATKSALVVYDGTTKIVSGGTATWPNTIYGVASMKILTLKNEGGVSLTLTSGPNYIASTGGAGQSAYGPIVQPTTLVLTPGSSASFSVTFTPPTYDQDYPVDFVVNSNDSNNPAFVFHGAGHSTQWHGRQALISAATNPYYASPRIAIAPQSLWASPSLPTLFAAYFNGSGIYIMISRDGGKTWSVPELAVSSSSVSALSIGVSTNINLLYLNSSNLMFTVSNVSSLLTSTQPDYTNYFASVTSSTSTGNLPISPAAEVKNSNMVIANGCDYLAFYNSTTSELQIAVRYDQTPYQGNPEFSVYNVTGVNSQTGGNFPSLQIDSSNAYIVYGDGRYTRVAVLPKPTPTSSDPSAYKYYQVSDNGNGSVITSSGFAIDGTKGYAFWRVNGGAVLDTAVFNDITLAAWPSPTVSTLSGESTPSTSVAPEVPFLVSNSVLYALYNNYGIRLSSSANGGANWTGQWLDNDASFMGNGSEVAMIAAGQVIYTLYTTNSSYPSKYSIMLMKSLDGGATW